MMLDNKIKALVFGAAMVFSFACYGQGELGNLPLGIMPMQLNSSFAGESMGPRLNTALSYKEMGYLMYAQLPAKIQSFGGHASYDQHIPGIKSGIGISFNRETRILTEGHEGRPDPSIMSGYEGEMHHNSLRLAIAPKITVSGKYTFSPSIDFGYSTLKGENRNWYPNGNTEVNPYDVETLNSRLGLLFSGSNFYFGSSTYIIDKVNPNTMYYKSGVGRYRTWIQAGYTFRKNSASKFSFSPQLAYIIYEGTSFNTDYQDLLYAFNLTFMYDKFLGGINNTGVHLGVETKRFRLIAGTLPWTTRGESPYRNNASANFYDLPEGAFSAANISFRYNFK